MLVIANVFRLFCKTHEFRIRKFRTYANDILVRSGEMMAEMSYASKESSSSHVNLNLVILG